MAHQPPKPDRCAIDDPAGQLDRVTGTISRRSLLAATGAATLARRPLARLMGLPEVRRPVPNSAQLQWQRDELAMFLHFGVNTFTDREWGDGKEDPGIFAPDALDARQWARVAKEAGFRTLILTAKHHDGFCLWPTRTTAHSVRASAFRGGAGDVVREFTDACRQEGLRAGVYLSPWDRNAVVYGDSPRYNDMYAAQLTELLTQYGRIAEVWFDGANGEGPNGRKQEYDWSRNWSLVRKLQPDAVIFSDAGPDVRWIGNEDGIAGETNWSTVDPTVVPIPGMSGDAVTRMLRQGDPSGSAWRPGETDVSIRPGWFYHPAEDSKVKSPEQLTALYFTSVGRNSKLLLNVPPDRHGLIHDQDANALQTMRQTLDTVFRRDLARGRGWSWKATGQTLVGECALDGTTTVALVSLAEAIEHGQIVSRYVVAGQQDQDWTTLTQGTTVGYRKLDRFAPTPVRRIRVSLETLDAPRPIDVALYSGD